MDAAVLAAVMDFDVFAAGGGRQLQLHVTEGAVLHAVPLGLDDVPLHLHVVVQDRVAAQVQALYTDVRLCVRRLFWLADQYRQCDEGGDDGRQRDGPVPDVFSYDFHFDAPHLVGRLAVSGPITLYEMILLSSLRELLRPGRSPGQWLVVARRSCRGTLPWDEACCLLRCIYRDPAVGRRLLTALGW